MDRLARAVCLHPWQVLGFIAAITLPLALFATRTRIDTSVETLVEATDPETHYYEDARRLFGSEEFDVVLVVTDDVYRPETLGRLGTLSERLRRTRGVARVTSLATIHAITSTPDGAVDVAPVMPEVPVTPAALAALRARVLADPLIAGNLVARDGQAAAILVTYDEMSDAAFAASGIHEEVERIVRDADGPERTFLTGTPTLKVRAARLLHRDVLFFTPLSTLVIMMVLLLAFRTWRGLLLPGAATGIGLVWTLGLMGLLGVPIDIATVVMPSLLIAVGSTYAAHVVARYYDEAARGGGGAELAWRALRHLGLPVLATALTTVLGFASLITYRVTAIRHLGLFSAFGIAALFVLALTFVAAALALLPAARLDGGDGGAHGRRLHRLLERIVAFDLRRPRWVIASGLVALAVSAWGIRYLRIDTNYLSYFPADSPERQANRALDRHLGGAVSFLVAIDGPEPGAMLRLETLRGVAALQDFITRLPGIVHTLSLVDYVRSLHRAFHDGDPAYFALPDTDRAVPQYLLLLDPEAVQHVVNADSTRGAILVRSSLNGSSDLDAALERIRDFATTVFPKGFSVRPTGTVVLLNRTADNLTRGQLQSILVALAVVFVTLSVLFLSPRLGLIALVPNAIPIVAFFGCLGWLDVPLSISTAVIASIALGLGVDEAIHLLTEFNRRVRVHAEQQQALVEAMHGVGPPVVYATTALSVGFLVPAFSGFVPVRQFAWLSAMNVFISLLADLFVLPAAMASVRFVTLWDVLTVRLGPDPHRTIPLFHGLRPSQARIAALLGQLRRIGAGQPIVTQGGASDAMYVLIDGSAEVRRAADGPPVTLASLARGDIAGELGLLRGVPRTADVIALEPTQVLKVDERFLRVLQRRYPRIAATVLLNLTRILSDRVQRTTERYVDAAEAHVPTARKA